MDLWLVTLIIGILVVCLVTFVWVAIELGKLNKSGAKSNPNKSKVDGVVDRVAEQAFTDEFREELRQRAREQFEKVIHENAVFLQQDVRMSAAKLDEFMKLEVVATLQQELAKHNQSISETRKMFNESIVENKRQLDTEISQERERRLRQLDENMTEVVKTYVMSALGEVLSGDQQLSLVIDNLNAHKNEIIEDIRNA